MELLDRELLFATFVTLFISFVLAKLISLAVAGSGDELGSKSTETADSAEKVVEDMKFVGGLRVQRSETKNRVQFVEEALEKVDDFGGETSVDESDKLLCGQEFKEKRCDSAGDVADVVGSSEKSPGGGLSEDEVAMEVLRGIGVEGSKEENVFTHSDGLVVDLISEGAEADEFDGVDKEERITGLVVEENTVENAEADDEMVAKLAGGENQRSGIEEELTKEDEKKGGLVDEDEDEDDWEGIERSELQGTFAAAANYVDQLPDLDSDVQMQLYGLHKVATEGPCYETQPMVLKVSARTKWNSWQRLGNMSPEVAMEQYINLLSDKVPGWMEGASSDTGNGYSLESIIHGASCPDISTDPVNQLNSTKGRELELKSVADGGDLTCCSKSVIKE